MSALHVFTNDVDSVIADSPADALRVLSETYGDDFVEDVLDPDAVYQADDDDEISIHCDASGDPTEPDSDDDAGVITKTARQWCARGRGFLCTTEF